MTEPHAILSADEIDSIRAPIESARTLPRRAFTSHEFFDREMLGVFHRNWAGLCLAGQLGAVGDVLPIDAFGVPLVAAHGKDGRIRIFHNVCPYDGCPVAMEPSSDVDHLTAKYHGWTYSLEGDLLEAPFWAGHSESGIDAVPAEYRRLIEVASGVAFGIVQDRPIDDSDLVVVHVESLAESVVRVQHFGSDECRGRESALRQHFRQGDLDVTQAVRTVVAHRVRRRQPPGQQRGVSGQSERDGRDRVRESDALIRQSVDAGGLRPRCIDV